MFSNLDKRFMMKYLAITFGKTGTPVDRFMPRAKGTTTLHSLVTAETENQFHDPEIDPSFMKQEDVDMAVGWTVTKALEITY